MARYSRSPVVAKYERLPKSPKTKKAKSPKTKKTKRTKKSPKGEKRAPSAYNNYISDCMADRQGAAVTDVIRSGAAKWKKMSQAQKDSYARK